MCEKSSPKPVRRRSARAAADRIVESCDRQQVALHSPTAVPRVAAQNEARTPCRGGVVEAVLDGGIPIRTFGNVCDDSRVRRHAVGWRLCVAASRSTAVLRAHAQYCVRLSIQSAPTASAASALCSRTDADVASPSQNPFIMTRRAAGDILSPWTNRRPPRSSVHTSGSLSVVWLDAPYLFGANRSWAATPVGVERRSVPKSKRARHRSEDGRCKMQPTAF